MRYRRPIITLTTDFGLSDHYVGVLHGVILARVPDATIVDVCHSVPPQNVAAAAFIVASSGQYFPHGTVHCVVVDPGVGSNRAIIVAKTPTAIIVAPDNGVLSDILRDYLVQPCNQEGNLSVACLAPQVQIFAVENDQYWLRPVSGTFHGRDIFAPVAAHLALGVAPERFGPPAQTVFLLSPRLPSLGPDGSTTAHIIWVDHFGNLITDLDARELNVKRSTFVVKGQVIHGLKSSYQEATDLCAIEGSTGKIEIALRNGNAAARLSARIGDPVEVHG